MEISEIDSRKTLNKQGGFMVHVSQAEAIELAVSLLEQIRRNDCNANRAEWNRAVLVPARGKECSVYFSVAVSSDREVRMMGDEADRHLDEMFIPDPDGNREYERGFEAGKAKGVLLGLREALRKVKKELKPFAYAIDAQCVILRAIKRRKEKR